MNFKDLSIRRKILLAMLAGIVLALLLSSLGWVTVEYFGFRYRAVHTLAAQAEVVGSSIYAAVDFNDNAAAGTVLASLRSSSEIVSAHLFNPDDQLIASYLRSPGSVQPPDPPKENGAFFSGGHLVLAQPLMREGKVFARLILESDLKMARQQFLVSISLLAVMLIMLMGISLLLSNWVSSAITRPLTDLTKTTMEVRSQKNYALRAQRYSDDEIGQLADSFNAMLGTLEQQNETVRKDEEFLDRLIESAGDAIFLADLQGRLIRVNQQAAQSLGYSTDTLKTMCIWDVDPGVRDLKEFSEIFPSLHSARVITVEGRHKRADGTTFPVEIRISMMESATGKYILGFARNVSERMKAEEELRRLAIAIEQSAEDVVITDATGRIEYVNPAFEKVSGYSRAEVIGQNPRILKSGKQNSAFYRDLWSSILKGQIWRGRFINRRKDGQLIEEEATISPILDRKQNIVGFVAVKRDITEQMKLEVQLRQAQKMEAVGQLAGGIAHDFNNILTVIIGHIELMQMEAPPNSHFIESLRELAGSAERARELTQQLLAYSRRQIMQMKLLNLNDVVNNFSRMLGRLIGEHITLESSLSSRLPPVRADAGMLEQVLTNLAVNARDAMPQGGRLRISTHETRIAAEDVRMNPEARAGHFVCLEVQDSGYGMDETVLRKIFEPFFTTKEVGKGTGLGLSMVYGIVKQHEGWVEVDSEVGKGSRFKVYLPVSAHAKKNEPLPAPQPELTGGTQTVLVVEDEPAVRRLICKTLGRYGYQVKEASHAEEALRIWESNPSRFDLLITDMIMPGGMSGLELAKQLLQKHPAIKIICSSGYSQELLVAKEQFPDFAFLAKPYNPADLLSMVRNTLASSTTKQNS